MQKQNSLDCFHRIHNTDPKTDLHTFNNEKVLHKRFDGTGWVQHSLDVQQHIDADIERVEGYVQQRLCFGLHFLNPGKIHPIYLVGCCNYTEENDEQ